MQARVKLVLNAMECVVGGGGAENLAVGAVKLAILLLLMQRSSRKQAKIVIRRRAAAAGGAAPCLPSLHASTSRFNNFIVWLVALLTFFSSSSELWGAFVVIT